MTGVLTLDPATKTGWAFAASNAVSAWPISPPGIVIGPVRGVVHGVAEFPFRRSEGEGFEAFSNFLSDLVTRFEPGCVVIEMPVMNRGQAQMRRAAGLRAIVQRVCWLHELRCFEVAPATVKKHFADHGRADKSEIQSRCRMRGWQPQDDNAADALAILDYAVTKLRTGKPMRNAA